MPRWSPRYAHVPLAVISLIVLVAIISWLLAERFDLWSVTRPPSPVIPVPSGPPPPPERPPGQPVVASTPPPVGTRDRLEAASERFALESGPFGTPEAADVAEDRLQQLGHATVRFQARQMHRTYVVAATGFATQADAAEAATQLGRGLAVDGEAGPEVLLARATSVGEALNAARTMRGLGLDLRVREEVTPRIHYVIRYGEFATRAEAEAEGLEVQRQGVASQVVKLRGVPPSLTPRTVGSGEPPGAAP